LAPAVPTTRGKCSATERPLAHGQRLLWLLHQLAPEGDAWTLAFVLRLRPPGDPAAARRAAQALVDRHAALRTAYPSRHGEPVQRVDAARAVAFDVVDATAWETPRLDAALAAAAARPIDLAHDPVLRFTLFRRAAGDLLLGAIHHIAADGWSLRLMLDDFRACYEAELAGAAADLPPAGAPYTEFVAWQADLLAGEEGRRLEAYWRDRLGADLPPLALPTARARWAPLAGDRRRVQAPLSAELTGRIRALARAEGATVYAVLLAACQALLRRYTGQDDLAIGSVTAGRPQARFRRTVGYFVNPVVIRADLADEPTFRQLLARARAAVAEARARQHYPLPLLLERLRPPGERGGAPLVQVALNHQKDGGLRALADGFVPPERRPVAAGDGAVELVALKREAGAVELRLDVVETAERLHVAADYRAALFDGATVERFLAHYTQLLESIVADPDRRLGALEAMPADERRRVLVDWNATAAASPTGAGLHELIAAQAARTPDAVAVEDAERRLTYRDLDARANQLAHHLRGLGVGPGRVVGLCLERSAELVVGLLGILKAGGAYLPLDPAYPAERLALMLREAGAMAVVTRAALAAALPADGPRRALVDADGARIARAPTAAPAPSAGAADLAYIIFTSGSTGRPKGVAVEHRALINLLTSLRARPGLGAGDTLLAVTTPAFDIAAVELFLPLLAGGRVWVAEAAAVADGRRLAELLARSGATVLQATPATWRLLLAAGWAGDPCLTALCGGEALPRALADQLLPRCRALWNLYGPTETTIWSAAQPVTPGDGPVPIGGPLANTRLYILDDRLRPVPIGARGELCIGGAGLARGYLGRPELTAERFVPDPFAEDPAARLYRTGDLARWRADGTIELLGRRDDQLKVRGFRVEPGEVEAALAAHPAVAQAVVAAAGAGEARRLVAYIVPRAGADPDAAEVRRFLAARLPGHLVPAEVVALARLPQTPSGKVDRRALAAAPAPPVARARPYAPPVDELERRLVAIWEEALGRHPIGVTDDFFELGGTSLLAARVHARIEDEFHRLPSPALFTASTVRQLAAHVRQAGASSTSRSLIPMRLGGERPPLFVVHEASGTVFFFRKLVQRLAPDQPVYGLQASGLNGDPVTHTRIEEMAAAYLDEIRRVQPVGPYYLLGYCVGGLVAYEMALRLQQQGEEVALLAMIEAFPIGRPVPIGERARAFGRRLASYFDLPKRPAILARQAATLPYWWLKGRLIRFQQVMAANQRRNDARSLPQAIEDSMVITSHAARLYRPGRLTGRPVLFIAGRRAFVDGAYARLDWAGKFGWEGLTTDGIDIHEVRGDHWSMLLDEAGLTDLLSHLERRLPGPRADDIAPAAD
jgi:amino acid adenylation domain-containing protein